MAATTAKLVAASSAMLAASTVALDLTMFPFGDIKANSVSGSLWNNGLGRLVDDSVGR
jgi:hypothetical protein